MDYEPTAREAAIWLQGDAEYLYRTARKYREENDIWMAVKLQENAAHSAGLAREQQAAA